MLNMLFSHGATDVVFPEPPADGDWVALAIVVAVLAAFTVWILIQKHHKKKASTVVTEALVVEAAPAPAAPGSAGELKLYNVEPRTAAMLMAIVADKMGKPLNELRFISIREVE